MKKIFSTIMLVMMLLTLLACVDNTNNSQNGEDQEPDTNTPDDGNEEPVLVVTKSSEKFLEGTLDEFEVYKFATNIAGPTIFIIGGIHGDERAGWQATISMLDYEFKRGTVYVLPVASRRACYGDPPVRYFETDLNRTFPGIASGTDTQVLAYTIYNAIKATNPDCVIDCHESRGSYSTTTLLGDQIIINDYSYSLYALSVVNDFNKLEMNADKVKFRTEGSPPAGSINKEFSEREGVPVFTLETNRDTKSGISGEKNALADRKAQQLALIDIILNTFEIEE